jgi:hypothetical protein
MPHFYKQFEIRVENDWGDEETKKVQWFVKDPETAKELAAPLSYDGTLENVKLWIDAGMPNDRTYYRDELIAHIKAQGAASVVVPPLFLGEQPVTDGDWSSTNYLQQAGKITTGHPWLIDVYEVSADSEQKYAAIVDRFGTHGAITLSNLDYAVHRALGIPISQADSVHTRRNIFCVIHCKKEIVWRAPELMWGTAMAVKRGDNWSIIPLR